MPSGSARLAGLVPSGSARLAAAFLAHCYVPGIIPGICERNYQQRQVLPYRYSEYKRLLWRVIWYRLPGSQDCTSRQQHTDPSSDPRLLTHRVPTTTDSTKTLLCCDSCHTLHVHSSMDQRTATAAVSRFALLIGLGSVRSAFKR